MKRLGIAAAAALAVAIVFAAPGVSGGQCGTSETGDICASGSAWYGFTRIGVQPAERGTSVAAAIREYRPGTDLFAEETRHKATSKTLSLGHGLSLSTDVYREPALTGFGLVLVNDGAPCFSWEWFDKSDNDVFSKLQGGGRVKVGIVESPGVQELAAVEFLDDIELKCRDQSNGILFEARIKKGSVLRLRP